MGYVMNPLLMDAVLAELPWPSCLDGIVIPKKKLPGTLGHMHAVFDRLRDARLSQAISMESKNFGAHSRC